MKITFQPAKSLSPDRERGIRVPYAPAKRTLSRWRWALILLLVSAPLLVIVGQIVIPLLFVSAPGLIVLERVPVNAAMPAVVEAIPVAPGDRVAAGAAVALLRSADLEQRLLVLRAEAAGRREAAAAPGGEALARELETGVRLAARVVDYQAEHLKGVGFLFDQGAATRAELQLAQAQLHQAEMGLAQARAALAARQADAARALAGDRENRMRLQLIEAELEALGLQQARLKALSPVPALVLEVPAQPGQAVGQGDPLLVLGNLEALSVTAYLDSRYIRFAHAGQAASVHLAGGRKLSAIVRDKPEIATRLPEAVATALSSREYTLLLTLDLLDQLPPGERVDHLPVTVHFPFSLPSW
jgi:multidrug resistance efflux pump